MGRDFHRGNRSALDRHPSGCRRSGVHDLASVDVEGLAGDVSRVGRSEVSGHRGELGGGLPAAERGDFADFFGGPVGVGLAGGRGEIRLAGGPYGFVEGGLHHAGRESVDADIVRGEVLRGTLHEVDQTGLRGAVGRIGLRTDLAGDGSEHEERAGAARDQARSERVRDVDGADEIEVEHARPVGGGEIPERKTKFAGADADGEDDVIDGREGGGEGLESGIRGDVAEGGLEGWRRTGGRGGRKSAIEAANGAAFGDEGFGDGAADALRGADDGDGLAGEMEVHGPISDSQSLRVIYDSRDDFVNVLGPRLSKQTVGLLNEK